MKRETPEGLNEKWPVVIVGAGPVGMLLASLLARRNVRCLVVEKRSGVVEWSRAIGIMPPSLEILAQAGVARELLRAGIAVENAIVHDDFSTAGTVNFSKIESEFNFILSCPQFETLRILERRMVDAKTVELMRGVELAGLEEGENSVQLCLKNTENGSVMHCRTKWVVACDGSTSTVRKLADFNVSHSRYGHTFVMSDYHDVTGWGRDAHLFFTRHGSLESFPLPDNRRRWIAQVTGDAPSIPLEEYLERQTLLIADVALKGARDSRMFEFEPERVAVSTLTRNRIVLAGDAAHVMSPIGGQGMNTGFGDANLLAEILPQLLKNGQSGSGKLLQTYNDRRQKSAMVASRRAAMGMWVGTRTGLLQSAVRSLLLRTILFKSPIHKKLAPHFSMLTIPHAKANSPVIDPSATRDGSEGEGRDG